MRKILLMLVPTVFLPGCGTIDQVPLVYVSTVQVGVGAETGTTAVPGGKLLIGVQTTDAAVVPIATGRNCGKGFQAACKKDDFPITQVRGENQTSVAELFAQARARADLIRKVEIELKTNTEALKKAEMKEAELASKTKLFDQNQAKISAYQQGIQAVALPPSNAENGGQSTPQSTLSITKPQSIAEAERYVMENANVGELYSQSIAARAEAKTQVELALREMENRRIELSALLKDDPATAGARNDALSVYGTFNTNVKVEGGTSSTAGLNLGKTFSTGVAAQILAEGIKEAAKSTSGCVASAGQLAAKFTAPADQKEVLLSALDACGRQIQKTTSSN